MSGNHQQAVPMINVHSLGKYTFCPRAGVIAHEAGKIEVDEDPELIPRLDYSLLFDVELLNERLGITKRQWIASAVGSSIVLGLAWIAFMFSWGVIDLLLFCLGMVFLRKLYLHVVDFREVQRRLQQHADARESRLGDPSAGPRKVNWWGLCKDELFSSTTPKEKAVSRNLGLAGKAARVATYAGVRIPVILHHDEIEEAKPYHRVRLAAHALLIDENQTGVTVSWGIVLNPISMRGLAIPLTNQDRNHAKQKLEEFRRCLRETENQTDPLAPPQQHCARCPHGRPRRYIRKRTETYSNGERLKPRLNEGTDKRSYHSPCGDRFDWDPPHEEANEKGFKKL